jgi:hypothetical protein
MTLLNDIDVGGTKYKYANSIPMGTCATPAGSEVKECAFADSFELAVGNLISVTFTYANTYGDGSTTYPKLLINGTQYPVKQPVGGYASSGAWANGQAVTFMFDGTNLVFLTVPVVDTVASDNMNSVSSNAVFSYVVDSVLFRDFRDDNFLPSHYLDKCFRERKCVFLEFKDGSVIGISANPNFFVMLITLVPWTNFSGGVPVQIVMKSDACWQRYAVDDSTWSSWKQVY